MGTPGAVRGKLNQLAHQLHGRRGDVGHGTREN